MKKAPSFMVGAFFIIPIKLKTIPHRLVPHAKHLSSPTQGFAFYPIPGQMYKYALIHGENQDMAEASMCL